MVISNSADAFRIQYNTLLLTGVWPKEDPSIFYRMKTLISWISPFGISVMLLTQFIYDIRDFTKLSETLYIMVSYMEFIVKLLVFHYGREKFTNMINFLKDPIFLSYSEDLDHYMRKSIKQSVLVASVYRVVAFSIVVGYTVFPVLDNKPLPFPFPYDLGKYTTLMYCLQVIGEGFSAINIVCFDVLCASLMGLAAAHLDILAGKIERLQEDDIAVENQVTLHDVDRNINGKLKNCVKHHVAIIKLVNSIEDVFTVALLGQFLTSAVVICNTIFNFILIPISTQLITIANYLVAILIQLFMYCWYGNELILKSLQIGNACYMSKWYAFDKKACKYLLIIMQRCTRPLRITTMKISVLSLTAFAAILQWSYSYLALLLNLYSEQSSQPTK